jgi:hypothetical protein
MLVTNDGKGVEKRSMDIWILVSDILADFLRFNAKRAR